jgi:hypothetical protein
MQLRTLALVSAAVLSAPSVGAPEEAKARVRFRFDSSATGTRMAVTVQNLGASGDIVSLVLGRDRGLDSKPAAVGKPKGWHERVVRQALANATERWQVWLSVDPTWLVPGSVAAAGGETGPPRFSAEALKSAIHPGETTEFSVVLLSPRGAISRSAMLVFASGAEQIATE